MLVRDGWESRQQGRSHGKFHSIDADQEFHFHCLEVGAKKCIHSSLKFVSGLRLQIPWINPLQRSGVYKKPKRKENPQN